MASLWLAGGYLIVHVFCLLSLGAASSVLCVSSRREGVPCVYSQLIKSVTTQLINSVTDRRNNKKQPCSAYIILQAPDASDNGVCGLSRIQPKLAHITTMVSES